MSKDVVEKFIQEVKSTKSVSQNQVRVHKFDVTHSTVILPYSRRDYYKVWITLGNGKIHYATRTIDITQPALIFSNPLVPYSYESQGVHTGYMCIFTEDFLKDNNRNDSLQKSPLFKIGSNPVFFLTDQQLSFISNVYEKMLLEVETSYVHRFEVIRNYVNLLIHEGLKMEPALHTIKYHNAAERIASLFLELLERQFPIDSPRHALRLKKPRDYAENLSVHVNHLNHVVREVTGKSTTAHISDRIIREARALLTHTELSISEIAYCLGFEYPSYFNNFFKKNTGLTPFAVRKAIL